MLAVPCRPHQHHEDADPILILLHTAHPHDSVCEPAVALHGQELGQFLHRRESHASSQANCLPVFDRFPWRPLKAAHTASARMQTLKDTLVSATVSLSIVVIKVRPKAPPSLRMLKQFSCSSLANSAGTFVARLHHSKSMPAQGSASESTLQGSKHRRPGHCVNFAEHCLHPSVSFSRHTDLNIEQLHRGGLIRKVWARNELQCLPLSLIASCLRGKLVQLL